jgi:3-methyladenine DNA glycosylase Tag
MGDKKKMKLLKAENIEAISLKYINENNKATEFVEKNFKKFSEQYEGKLIAVKNKKIIASSEESEELVKKIKKSGHNPNWTYITSFPPKGLTLIL